MKLGKDKGKDPEPEKSIIDHLVDYGLDKQDAEALAVNLDKFKELQADDIKDSETNGKSTGFVEKSPRKITIDSKEKLDLIKFLMDISPEDTIEKRIAMSEIPPHVAMPLVLSKTIDDLCSKRKKLENGQERETPTQIYIKNFTTVMRGLSRKGIKEGLHIFETDIEKGNEEKGLFPTLRG